VNNYQITTLPMDKIDCDASFNVRGFINPAECYDLAKDIQLRGLDMPISVWTKGDRYQVLAGHRRYTAFKINQATEIPCYIRDDIVSMYDAMAYNLRENILRKDLNLAQEAKRIGVMLGSGKTVAQVAEDLGKTSQWVEPRRQLVLLGSEVMEAAEKSIINQSHIAVLYEARKDPQRMLELLRELKLRHESGEKGIKLYEPLSEADMVRIRRPKQGEVVQLREFMADNLTKKLGNPYYLPHVLLSWFLGDTNLQDVWNTAIEEAEANNIPFSLPSEIEAILPDRVY
jgi:ParB/RepB/Spo0J family partition protein